METFRVTVTSLDGTVLDSVSVPAEEEILDALDVLGLYVGGE
jgi:hypothetical protein